MWVMLTIRKRRRAHNGYAVEPGCKLWIEPGRHGSAGANTELHLSQRDDFDGREHTDVGRVGPGLPGRRKQYLHSDRLYSRTELRGDGGVNAHGARRGEPVRWRLFAKQQTP